MIAPGPVIRALTARQNFFPPHCAHREDRITCLLTACEVDKIDGSNSEDITLHCGIKTATQFLIFDCRKFGGDARRSYLVALREEMLLLLLNKVDKAFGRLDPTKTSWLPKGHTTLPLEAIEVEEEVSAPTFVYTVAEEDGVSNEVFFRPAATILAALTALLENLGNKFQVWKGSNYYKSDYYEPTDNNKSFKFHLSKMVGSEALYGPVSCIVSVKDLDIYIGSALGTSAPKKKLKKANKETPEDLRYDLYSLFDHLKRNYIERDHFFRTLLREFTDYPDSYDVKSPSPYNWSENDVPLSDTNEILSERSVLLRRRSRLNPYSEVSLSLIHI